MAGVEFLLSKYRERKKEAKELEHKTDHMISDMM